MHTAPPLATLSVEEHKESNTKRAAAVDVVVGQVQCYAMAVLLVVMMIWPSPTWPAADSRTAGYHRVGSKTLLRNRPSKYALDHGLLCIRATFSSTDQEDRIA